MSFALAATKLLPEKLRHAVLRSQMRFAANELDGVVVKLVETPEEALAASHIVHRAYACRGLLGAKSGGLRVTPHSILPTTHTFVAKVGDLHVGSLSLIVDGALGLPLEKIYGDEIAAYRERGERLAEVGAYAILPGFRRKGIVHLLNRLMYETALAVGVDRVVVAVHPKVEDLYKASMLFSRFGSARSYPGLGKSALAVGLELNVQTALARYTQAFDHLPKDSANPLWLYVQSERPELVPARTMTEHRQDAIARALVASCPEVFGDLPPAVRVKMRGALPTVRMTCPEMDVKELRAFALAHMVPA